MLENPLPIEQARLRRGAKSEVGGGASEVEATFQACLHVGKFDRAEGLVERLGQIYASSSDELIAINHQYVRSLLRNIEYGRKQEDYKRLTKWVDKQMDKFNIEKDGLSYAALLRSAFLMLDGTKQERTIKRYWQAVQDKHLEASVISTAMLTDADLGMLSEICPSEIKHLAEQYEATSTETEVDGEIEADIDINPSSNVASARSPDSSPVMSTEQRGVGLKYLQESLGPLSEPVEEGVRKPWITAGENAAVSLRQRQEHLETLSVDTALRRWREERETSAHHHDAKKLGALLYEWQKLVTEKIQEELQLIDEAEKSGRKQATDQDRLGYGPFLRLVPTERLAGLTIITFLTMMAKMGNTNEIKMSSMMVSMGKAVHMEAVVASLRDNRRQSSMETRARPSTPKEKALSKFIENTTKVDGPNSLWKVIRRLKQEDWTADSGLALSPNLWSNVTYAKIGGVLTQFLTDVAKVHVSVHDQEIGETISALQPAFQRNYKYELGRRTAFLKMHERVEELLRKDPRPSFIVKHLPMVCPPKPWKGFAEGGYYKTSAPVVRLKNGVDRQRRYIEVAANRGDLKNFFAGLDVLGRTSWKINPDVYKVMLEAWNSGEAVANLAPYEYNEPLPPKPEDWADNPTSRRRWYNEVAQHQNKKSALHSERCFQNLQMEMAQNYLNETFYLPHNADFRGRAYPLAPYLNQMGADNARSLLFFGKGRPLGAEGLRWLKIHLANVFGYDKASFRDREQFAMDHLNDIRDSVDNPLTGRRWWLEGEDPWQCLATCFELQHALDSPDPLQYVSHLPVHQDGSCNGLQHYAALGGDIAGAQQVNLEPGDKPSDVYTGVAELIKADIAKEAAEGRKIAKLLQGKIKRKIVKQTVMTNVYGVTFLGATRQVRKQLEAHYPEMNTRGSVPISGVCAAYIARKIFNALGTIFTGAHQIQFWLGDCASRISASITPEQVQIISQKAESSKLAENGKAVKSWKKSPERQFRSGVTWTTPLNLTVVQPYRNVATTLVSTAFQQVSIKDPQETDTVDKRRQLQAFPPNFVHSLDATHMILSALRCDAAGLSFSAVHDSFWTHAADINDMNRLLRDAFVQMHGEDVIGRLANEFDLRYSRHIFRASIRGGNNPVRKKVEAWRRDYRKKHNIRSQNDMNLEELKLEVKRQELLRSEDPKERQLGAEMVTPGAIYDECDGEQYLTTQKSLGETALGHIPETAPEEIINAALDPKSTDPDVNVDMEHSIGPIMQENTGVRLEEINESETSISESQQQIKADYVHAQPSLTLREEILQHLGFSKDKQLSEGETLLVEMLEESRLEAKKKEEQKIAKKASKDEKPFHIWLPLRFAKVPKRGEWDIRRLKESDYFFS